MDTRTVPHGAVAVVTYYYLLHGTNESDDSRSTLGRGNFILDNLIADGKAVPMIVVMPNGHIDQTPPNSGAPASQRVEFATFPNEFTSDIMPYVENHYRTIPDRPHRAIAGLSGVDHGRIALHGRDVTHVAARKRGVTTRTTASATTLVRT